MSAPFALSLHPLTRSRTLLFLSYRDSSTPRFRPNSYRDHSERRSLIPSDADPPHSTIDITLPPKWFDISDQVQDILQSTVTKIHALEKIHAKHVLPGFSDKSAEEREIELHTTAITRAFRQCQSLIQQIAPDKSHQFPPTSTPSQHEILTAQNVQRGLAAKVQELSASFRKKQRIYLEKLQGHSIKNQDLLIASGALSLKGSDSVAALEEDVRAASQSQTQMHADPDLRTRDRELNEIAKSISSLAETFRDLSTLVIDQGTILDSVEFNVENTAVYMQEAVKELDIATRYQKNTGRRKCIFLLLLIIFGLILVLIFKPRKRSDLVTTPSPMPTESP